MINETLVSRSVVKDLQCDICSRTDDVVEYLTTPMYMDDGVDEPQKGIVRIYRLCRKCLNTGLAVLDDSKV